MNIKQFLITCFSLAACFALLGFTVSGFPNSSEPKTKEQKIAASRAVDDRAREKNKEDLADVQARAELAWLMIDQADRNAICYAYNLDAVGTMDQARTTWRSQGHSEREVKALAGSVRSNC